MNNSGITWGGPFLDFPEEKGWDNVFNVNVKSIFYSALCFPLPFGLLVGLTMCFLFSLSSDSRVCPGHESQYRELTMERMEYRLSDLLSKDSNNVDPGRVINISSTASVEPGSEGSLSGQGNGTWSCTSMRALYPFDRRSLIFHITNRPSEQSGR